MWVLCMATPMYPCQGGHPWGVTPGGTPGGSPPGGVTQRGYPWGESHLGWVTAWRTPMGMSLPEGGVSPEGVTPSWGPSPLGGYHCLGIIPWGSPLGHHPRVVTPKELLTRGHPCGIIPWGVTAWGLSWGRWSLGGGSSLGRSLPGGSPLSGHQVSSNLGIELWGSSQWCFCAHPLSPIGASHPCCRPDAGIPQTGLTGEGGNRGWGGGRMETRQERKREGARG